MDSITQKNAAMVEESSAATSKLSDEAAKLAHLVSGFKVINRPHGGRHDGREAVSSTPPATMRRPQRAGRGAAALAAPDWAEF